MPAQPSKKPLQDIGESEHEADSIERLPLLEKLDLVVNCTKNFSGLLEEAVKSSIISQLERDTITNRFGTGKEQLSAFYLLLSSKPIHSSKVFSLMMSTGNERVGSLLGEKLEEKISSLKITVGRSTTIAVSDMNREGWPSLQKMIANNIDRLSSHTRNLGLVLCFASGIGLITGKDREIIANYSQLEMDQLKKFYSTVSEKDEDAYEKLLKVLKMTSNNWALDVLEIRD